MANLQTVLMEEIERLDHNIGSLTKMIEKDMAQMVTIDRGIKHHEEERSELERDHLELSTALQIEVNTDV